MGVRNYLIEGVSGVGKTAVAEELQRLGYHVIHGDRALAYQGDPKTGEPLDGLAHEHHIWNLDKVRALVADQSHAASFFCGGSRNFSSFIDLFDRVFVLEVDLATLLRRLAERPEDEFGARPSERALIVRLHATKEDIPKGDVVIDATAPLERVVDAILEKVRLDRTQVTNLSPQRESAAMDHDPKHLQQMMQSAAPPDLDLTFRPMFGGILAYLDGKAFASLSNVGLALKLAGADHAELLALPGAKPLQYEPNSPPSKSYVTVPEAMLKDPDALRPWIARGAAGLAKIMKKPRKARTKPRAS